MVWWKLPYGYIKFCNIDTHQKKLIHCVAIFTILYGNDYPTYGEFKLICIGKFARRTWVNFTQQYRKNRQRCQKKTFYYAVWQLLLYYYRKFPSKTLSVYFELFRYLWRKYFNWMNNFKMIYINSGRHIYFFTTLIREQGVKFLRRVKISYSKISEWLTSRILKLKHIEM